MKDEADNEVDPLSVAIVLRQSKITFGGHEQTALPERSAWLIEAQAARITELEAQIAARDAALATLEARATAVLEAMDRYNAENGMHLGGALLFQLGKAIAKTRQALQQERDHG